ncbi:hypothetical protein B0H10DRAFT_2240795 [Mycena sp. CBHHK59/15]|nr:hypothetical protein B0H10DRAFT_2240795 [Mycena sp. CBHHK59/15]
MDFLPLELEREIFELCAWTDAPTAAVLTRTCVRAQEWIEPILYHSIVLHAASRSTLFIRTLNSRPRSFFAQRVKTLYLDPGVLAEGSLLALSTCSGIRTLALRGWWPPSDHDPSINTLALNIMDAADLRRVIFPAGKWDFGRPAFRNITHLVVEFRSPFNVHLIPHLTHLAVYYPGFRDAISKYQETITQSPRLELFIILHDFKGFKLGGLFLEPTAYKCCLISARSTFDYEFNNGPASSLWKRAEQFIIEQRMLETERQACDEDGKDLFAV